MPTPGLPLRLLVIYMLMNRAVGVSHVIDCLLRCTSPNVCKYSPTY